MKLRSYWLVKSEPSVYSFSQLQSDNRTAWTGVRNFEARNNLRAMKKDDLALFYHSGEGRAIVGLCKVVKTAYPDPTGADDRRGEWVAVDVAPVKALKVEVTLAQVKQTAALKDFLLVKRSRLSVVPVEPQELERVLELAQTRL